MLLRRHLFFCFIFFGVYCSTVEPIALSSPGVHTFTAALLVCVCVCDTTQKDRGGRGGGGDPSLQSSVPHSDDFASAPVMKWHLCISQKEEEEEKEEEERGDRAQKQVVRILGRGRRGGGCSLSPSPPPPLFGKYKGATS